MHVSRVVNCTKSLSNLLKRFLYLMLSELQKYKIGQSIQPNAMGGNFLPVLVCPQKAIVRIKFLAYFLQSSRYEKCCHKLERMFEVFHHSKNIHCFVFLLGCMRLCCIVPKVIHGLISKPRHKH